MTIAMTVSLACLWGLYFLMRREIRVTLALVQRIREQIATYEWLLAESRWKAGQWRDEATSLDCTLWSYNAIFPWEMEP